MRCPGLLLGVALAATNAGSSDHTATWTGDIWGLPNGLLPAGPVIGMGDFGMSLQTNNATGCIELWLGLNSMWGMPATSENPLNNTLGSSGTSKPFAPYPSQQFLGALKICIADATFRLGANFTAEQRLADGTILARYVATDGRRSFRTRLFLHPTDKLLVAECAFDGLAAPADAPIVTLQSWTKTLWFNATAEAAAESTRAGWDAASGTQWFSRVAIPGNDAARRSKQLQVVVGTRLIGGGDSSGRALGGTGNHSVQCNETAARAASHACSGAAIGATLTISGGSQHRFTLLTLAKSNLDLGDDFSVDPLSAALAQLTAVRGTASIKAANDQYWRSYWQVTTPLITTA